MNIKEYNRDIEYWNNYYASNSAVQECSPFALFVWNNYLNHRSGRLLELGCGNGRDSNFFIDKSICLTGIDASWKAIELLNKKHLGEKNSKFVCGDFVTFDDGTKYSFCYSRFSVHSISAKQESDLLERIGNILDSDGCFFVEVRSVNDEIYGKGELIEEDAYVYNGHYRRFIRIEQLIKKMVEHGFVIDYAAEKRGFAPYGMDDPMVIRVVGRKR